MNEIISIEQDDKDKKFVEKMEDRTCIVEIKHRGVFEGIIESFKSSGKYMVRLTKKIEDR